MKIAIIGAMEEEIAILRENIDIEEVETAAKSEFTQGKLYGKDIILLKSGIGKVNAAMTTTILLEKYKPDVVINTGSAGGLNPELNIGDVVISTEVRHHDVDATVFGYEFGQVPQMPPAYAACEKLQEIAYDCAQSLEGIKTVKGLIATGDAFMSDPERVQDVGKRFTNTQAVEMEAAAIAQVCYQYDVPFVIIRSLSDIAGKENNGVTFEQYLEKAAMHSAKLVMEIAKKL